MRRQDTEESDLIRNLVEALDQIPHACVIHVEDEPRIGNDQRLDAAIDLDVAGERLRLIIEIKNQAFPRDIREAVWQLRRALRDLDPDDRLTVPFIAAATISDGARVALQEEEVGYFDLSGTLSIPVPRAFVMIDRPPTKRSRRAHDAIFQGKRSLVLQAVFKRRDQWLGVSELARETHISPATVSETLTELDQRDWVMVRGSGPTKERRLRDTDELLDNWARFMEAQKPPKLRRYYVPGGSAQRIAARLARSCNQYQLDYAVTGEAAAEHYAPHLSVIKQVRCRLAPGDQQGDLLSDLEARPVAEGWNLGVIEVRSESDIVVAETADGIAYAEPIQVWLDLLQASGRSRDAAAHLRTELFGPR